MRGGQHQIGRDALGQDVKRHHPQRRGAAGAPGFHVRHLADRERHRPDHPPSEWNARDRDREDHRGQAGPDGHRDRHGEDEVGERLEDLHDALAHEVEPPAQVAAGDAPQRADRRAEDEWPDLLPVQHLA